jgi:2-polyprenyl-3-methyl-5-hydroxy-6-metoxy-1,4-benzoquinol methylase
MASDLSTRIADRDPLLGMLGWPAVLLYADPCAFDRWLWLRQRLLPGRMRTLDAGSGNGSFAMYAAKRGNDVTALSYSASDQEKAERRANTLGLEGIDFQVRDLRKLDEFASELGLFDQVVCFEVIEHILDDNKLLRDLAEVTAPGGRLLLTTPNRYHVPFFGERISEVEDGHHLREGYTHDEMKQLLSEAGFRVAAGDYMSGIASQKAFNIMYRLNRTYPHLGWGVTLPLRLLRPVDGPLTRITGYPYLSIGVVAVRN